MEDKELQDKLLKKLLRFEEKMDWVGETYIRQRVSEHIADIRELLKLGPAELELREKQYKEYFGE